MHQAITGAIIGGVAGGGIAAATGRRNGATPEPAAPAVTGTDAEPGAEVPALPQAGDPAPPPLGGRVAKGALAGASLGASIGLFRNRRAAAAATALAADGAAAAKHLLEDAKPKVDAAVVVVKENAGEAKRVIEETVIPAVADAGSRAAGSVSSALDAAQPKVAVLVESAKGAARDAQPHVEKLVGKAAESIEQVQPKLAEVLEQVQVKAAEAEPQLEKMLDRASSGVDVVIERAKPLADSAQAKAAARAG